MAFSDYQVLSLTIAVKISAGLSIVGCVIVFFLWFKFPKLQTFVNRMVLFMNLSDLATATCQFIGKYVLNGPKRWRVCVI